MKLTRMILIAAATLLVGNAITSPARAQHPLQAHPGLMEEILHMRGFGAGGMMYSLNFVPVPPYFALHPPVYYSHPVPRPYGYSPYSYPGTVMTPAEYNPPKVQDVVNPYVTPKTDEPKDRTAALPAIMINPFVAQAEPSPAVRLARIEK